jgi:hypothetical protein
MDPRRAVPWLAFTLPLALALLTMPQGTAWLDSPEFSAAARELGVPHPPGHPLYLALARALDLLLPVGPAPFRLNLLSALLAAAACALLASVARRLLDRLFGERAAHAWLGLAAAWLLACGPSLWLQAQRAEVYTLNLFLLLAAVRLLLWDDARAAPLAGLVLGSSLGNHHYLMTLSTPALLALGLKRGRLARDLALASGAALLATGLLYAFLPLRGRLPLLVDWARPGSLSAAWDVMTAKVFQASLGHQVGSATAFDPLDNVFALLSMLFANLGLAGLLLALAGVYLALRRAPRVGLALALLLAGGLLAKGLMQADPHNPDDHGYLLPALSALALGAVVAWAAVPWLLKRWHTPLAGAALLLALAPLPWRWAELDAWAFDAPERTHQALVEALPPGGAVFPAFYPVHFLLTEKLVVEGARPDLAVLHQSLDFKVHRGVHYARDLARLYPELAPVLSAFAAAGEWPQAASAALARDLPLHFAPAPDLPFPPAALVPAGWLFRLAPPGVSAEPAPADPQALASALDPAWRTDRTTRMVLVDLLYSGARVLLERGDQAAAAARVGVLEQVSPRSPEVQALARRLR